MLKRSISFLLFLCLTLSVFSGVLALEQGDLVSFGSYQQNIPGQPIEWRVLAVYGSTAVLITEEILDCTYYDLKKSDWEPSHMCKWLNSKFFTRAFTAEERRALIRNNEGYYITFPSLGDMTNEDYGFMANQDAPDYTRIAVGTSHAEGEGLKREQITGAAAYYTKTAASNGKVYCVSADGTIGIVKVNRTDIGVRPIIYLDLNAVSLR